MTEAGRTVLPDLDAPFVVPADVVEAIKAMPGAWAQFEQFPDLYVRVRIGYVEEMRGRPDEHDRRLANFIRKTAEGKLFGNWNDDGLLATS